MERDIIVPERLGRPLGPYSHAMSIDPSRMSRLVFVAGQVSTDGAGRVVGPGDMRAQFAQVYANLQAVLEAAGGTLEDIVSLRTFLTRADDLPIFNDCRRELYPALFPKGVYPPNTLLIIDRLVLPELLLEIEAIAAI